MTTIPFGELGPGEAVYHVQICIVGERIADDPIIAAPYRNKTVAKTRSKRPQPFECGVVGEDDERGRRWPLTTPVARSSF